MAGRIVEHLGPHSAYLEPFCGSCAVALAKPPCRMEVLNDLSGNLVNLIRVIQRDELAPDLFDKLNRTAFCEDLYRDSLAWLARYPIENAYPEDTPFELTDPVRAHHYFVASWMGRNGLVGTTLELKSGFCVRYTSGGGDPAKRFREAVAAIPWWWERLRNCTVLRRDGIELCERFEDRAGSVIYCLHPSSPVRLADERIVPIKDIEVGAKLFGGRTVIHAVNHHHSGEMLSVKVQGLPDEIRVTPEHVIVRVPKRTHKRQETRSDAQLWNAREEVQAESLQVGDYMLIPVGGDERPVAWGWRNDSAVHGVRREATFSPSRLLFRLLGYYAAEGHLQRDGFHLNEAILSFGTHELETWVKDAAECCQAAFGFEPRIRPGPSSDSVRQVVIGSRSVAEFFNRLVPGVATNKAIHPDLMTAPLADQRELLLGWLRGDGGIELASRGRAKLLGTSHSETLARQMFQIALRLGLRPSFKTRAGGAFDVYFSTVDAVSLGYLDMPKRVCATRRIINGHILARVKSVSRHPYIGPVCDITVDGDGLFAAPFALVHNCDPPYLQKQATYTHDFDDAAHVRLAAALCRFRHTRVVVSYYAHERLAELYPGWRVVPVAVPKNLAVRAGAEPAPEVLLINQP